MANVMQKPAQTQTPTNAPPAHRSAPPTANQTNARGMVPVKPSKARQHFADGAADVEPSLLDRTANASTAAYAQAGDALRAGNLPAAAGAAVHGLVATPAAWLARGAQLAPDFVGSVGRGFADLGRGLVGAPVAAAPAAAAAPAPAAVTQQAAIPVSRDDAATALSQATGVPRAQMRTLTPGPATPPGAHVTMLNAVKAPLPAALAAAPAPSPLPPQAAHAVQNPQMYTPQQFSAATAGHSRDDIMANMSLHQRETYARSEAALAQADAARWNMQHYDPKTWALTQQLQAARAAGNKAEETRLLGHMSGILAPQVDPSINMPAP